MKCADPLLVRMAAVSRAVSVESAGPAEARVEQMCQAWRIAVGKARELFRRELHAIDGEGRVMEVP